MIAFNVNGEFLDLYDNTSIQIARVNHIFAFDEMQVSRTTSFDIPATPKNNRIFNLAKDVAYDGAMARVKIPTEFQFPGGTEQGNLYIGKCNGNKYTVTYYFGELLTLKKLRGNKVTSPGGTCYWGNSSQVWNADAAYADDGKGEIFGIVKYKPTDVTQMNYWGSGLQPFPSLSLYRLLYKSMYDLGIYFTVTGLSYDIITNYRLVPPKLVNQNGESTYAATYGRTLRASENIPDVEIVKLLKTLACLTNTAIRLTDATHINLLPVNFSAWSVMALDKLVELGDVSRTFANYAQSNTIVFDGGRVQPYGTNPYTIPNTNLEKDKEMLSIPVSSGDSVSVVQGGITYINSAVNNFELKTTGTPPVVSNESQFIGDKWTIMSLVNSYYGSTADTSKYMFPAKADRMTWLSNLMTTSTSIKVSAVMTLSDFNHLAEDKIIDVRGQLFVWTSGTWQDGIATLELSKITI